MSQGYHYCFRWILFWSHCLVLLLIHKISIVAWRGAGGTCPPPPYFWQARLIWSAATFFTLLFGSMCSFRFDEAWKLFIYGFCDFSLLNLLEINALGRLKMLFQRPYISSMLFDPPSSSSILRSWLAPLINRTLLRHCTKYSCRVVKKISQGHPTTVFCKIFVRRRIFCLEFSITWGRLKISGWPFHSWTIFESYLINFVRFYEA